MTEAVRVKHVEVLSRSGKHCWSSHGIELRGRTPYLWMLWVHQDPEIAASCGLFLQSPQPCHSAPSLINDFVHRFFSRSEPHHGLSRTSCSITAIPRPLRQTARQADVNYVDCFIYL